MNGTSLRRFRCTVEHICVSLLVFSSFLVLLLFTEKLEESFVPRLYKPQQDPTRIKISWEMLERLLDNVTFINETALFPLETIFDDSGESSDSHTPYTSPTIRPKKPSIPLFPKSPTRKVWLVSVIPATQTTINLLPHFIDYYIKFGVQNENFLIVIQQKNALFNRRTEKMNESKSTNDTNITISLSLATILSMFSKYNISPLAIVDDDFTEKNKWRRNLLSIHRAKVPLDDWILEVDVDEFIEPTEHMSVHELWKYFETSGISFVPGFVMDRVRRDGRLVDIYQNESIWDQFPIACDITASVGLGNPYKIPLHKGFLMTTVGRNSLADIEYAKSMDVWDISPYSQIQNSSSLVFKTPKNDRYRLRINSFQWIRGAFAQIKEKINAHYSQNDVKWKEYGRLHHGAVKCKQYWPNNIRPFTTLRNVPS